MTVLENSIRINASPEEVWSVLTSLEALDRYDPGIKKAEIISESRDGPGSARRCDLAPGGWFKEKVADWNPHESLSFELFECTLPIRRLKHSYTLIADGGATVVHQRMEYELKFGPVGRLMDAMMVRKKWDAGIKGFFTGLKRYVETNSNSPTTQQALAIPSFDFHEGLQPFEILSVRSTHCRRHQRGGDLREATWLPAISQRHPRVLNQAVKRHTDRFPEDFIFQLSADERSATENAPQMLRMLSDDFPPKDVHSGAEGADVPARHSLTPSRSRRKPQ